MKVFLPTDFAALIGIDWADKKHDICEYDTAKQSQVLSTISSRSSSIHQWAQTIRERYPQQRIAVGCELTKGPLIYALSQYDHLVLFPLNPSTVAKYRKAFTPSGAKDDPTDAAIQMELLLRHMDKLTALEPESAELRSLAQLVENRRKLVKDQVRLTSRIGAALKNYYPQAVDWFDKKDTVVFCDFIEKWPTLAAVKRARPQTIRRFFNQHNVRSQALIEKRILSIQSAVALTDDVGVIEPNQFLVEAMIGQLRVVMQAVDAHQQYINQRYRTFSDRRIFDSLPGAGAVFAPRLLVAFGENRARYQSAADMQRYAGIAPVVERSGQKSWTHWRYSCPTFLRQSFVEWAGESVRYSFWAKAFYEQQKAKGKPHQTIIRSLAFKWIRIIFRCWQDRKPYDESTYLAALKKRNSPLLEFAVMT